MECANVFDNYQPPVCNVCGKNLIDNPKMSLINVVENIKTHKIKSFIPCCKGKCDDLISKTIRLNDNYISKWNDVFDYQNPYLYLKYVISMLNLMQSDEGFENKEAFESFKKFIIAMFPYVSRNMTKEEKDYAKEINSLPIM